MIQVTFFKNKENELNGFHFVGHAEYGIAGEDVVCAGVSALVFNTVNCIEYMTEDTFTLDTDEKTGRFEFHITSSISHDTAVLLQSLSIGVQGISNDYGTDFVKIHFKEV